MGKKVFFKIKVIKSLLNYFKACHPNEGILLLRGKVKKDKIVVEEVIIPPFSEGAEDFSTFNPYHLPLDFSIIGSAHSHPNGVLKPSLTDLTHFYGFLMVIGAYPYEDEKDLALYDKEGKRIIFGIEED
ncbi:MAG: Mov34/MPN/PAD-1 family protein [Nitrososphaerales archaeon]